ncbi:protein kinase [Streptomyces sp. NPDC001843]|uniref:serine/threonine-protein kinase n=1 Tax=Streptomyces sp. NPDC001843 TaxID=3364617 RepID=UPI00368053F5
MAGRYRLAESIGQGGMGRVWRAADEILDREVAVKEMRIDGLDAEDTRTRRERTLREARATARIDHPNVVRVYDVVDAGDRLWIVMELVAGRSLEHIMATAGPLGPREAARIGLGLVAALRQVHAGGVLHRDIKPGNVLVEAAGDRVVLTDFGIAAIQDAKALTVVGMLVGSPDYMAPERISGRRQGPPSDVWSLGATLCAALAGHSPFSRDTTLGTLHAVLYEEPELPPGAGPLRDILAALLEKEPSTRPDLTEVEEALRPVAFPDPTPTLQVTESGPADGEAPAGGGRTRAVGVPEERPTPVFVDAAGLRPARDPRVPEPGQERGPGQVPVPEPVPDPEPESAPDPVPAPEPTHEPVPDPAPAGPPVQGSRPGVSLNRAQAATQARPKHTSSSARSTRTADDHRGERSDPRHGRRRTALLAALGAVAVAAVVAILPATSADGPGHDAHAGSSPGPSAATSAPISPSPTSPSPTVEGTSRPQSLPPGAHREAGGYAWRTPEGWRRDVKTGAEVHYTSPDGRQELVAKSSLARGDLLDTWRASERSARQGRDYAKIRLAETTFQGHPAVVWEYTFTLGDVAWHARLLGFDANGKSYQVNTWYQPEIESGALKTYDTVKDSFTVL